MANTKIKPYDILVAGAGFAGSLTALILHSLGFKVCLLEKGQHPRFTIGESSTPVADMILRDLSEKYKLPWLYDFSRYGSWQRSHPEIICGIKRGFSFFKHYPGKDFTTNGNHINELLVAASSDDDVSDTNWLRADFDSFLVDKVKASKIEYADLTEIVSAKRNSDWEFLTIRQNNSRVIHASFFIDATGSSMLLERLIGIKSSAEGFLTNSFAMFSHFNKVPLWTDMLKNAGISIEDYPYDPDLSALHQILDEGWLWMLRFNDDRVSMGLVLDYKKGVYNHSAGEKIWKEISEKYPAINKIFENSSLAGQPGKMIRSERLQRKISNCFGPGWIALPPSAGFVDPLFSSGIAYTLSGIEKVIDIIEHYWDKKEIMQQNCKEYENAVFSELKLSDQLIAGCYKTMAHFELFKPWSMLYFAAIIAHESRRKQHHSPGYFLNADDPEIWNIVGKSYTDLSKITDQQEPTCEDVFRFTELIRKSIQPYNTAGLLDPSLNNMYRHTATTV